MLNEKWPHIFCENASMCMKDWCIILAPRIQKETEQKKRYQEGFFSVDVE